MRHKRTSKYFRKIMEKLFKLLMTRKESFNHWLENRMICVSEITLSKKN